jgi:hypothetical protein
VSPRRLERLTYGFEARRSIQLSYGPIFVSETFLMLIVCPCQGSSDANVHGLALLDNNAPQAAAIGTGAGQIHLAKAIGVNRCDVG